MVRSMAAEQPVGRPEFDGYVLRHEHDRFAHASMARDLVEGRDRADELLEGRLTVLERWQQRMIGGLAFGALMLGGGGIAAVLEFWRK